MDKFLYLFLLFFIYSVLGWLIETIHCSINQKKMVMNRGFLIGPYCPIYGFSAVIMILFLSEYKEDIFTLFAMSIVYSSLIEYFTSYLMEKIFKARWWDYSDYKFNIAGRICLRNCLYFGILGVVLILFINPVISNLILNIPKMIFRIISIIIFVIIFIDTIISFSIISRLKLNISKINTDSTEEIDKQIRQVLARNRLLKKRIFKAFPRIQFNNDKSRAIITSIRKSFGDIEKGLNSKKEEIKQIKNNIKILKNKDVSKKQITLEKNKLKEIRRKKV